jgi:hypothetical protein
VKLASRYYVGPISDHFDGVRFFDTHGVPPKSFADLLRWWSSRSLGEWPKRVIDIRQDNPPARVDGPRWRVTFVGHATLLIQLSGINILTDPVWSERVSPFSFAGPKRVHDPGIAFDALPPIDAVLLSHNHWDHLDLPTLSRRRCTIRVSLRHSATTPSSARMIPRSGAKPMTGAIALNLRPALL